MKLAALTLSLFLAVPCWAHKARCNGDLNSENQIESQARQLSHDVANSIEANSSGPKKKVRGYAILVGAMVGSAAVTTYLTSKLPPEMQFLSLFCAQISALGVYQFGAPIWAPIGSVLQKLAFNFLEDGGVSKPRSKPKFERIWRRTQGAYSMNAQMSRNLENSFFASTGQVFYEAHRAMTSGNPVYAADQIALAAWRMRRFFEELLPDDEDVTEAVHTAFTRHVTLNKEFRTLVEAFLTEKEPGWETGDNAEFYNAILSNWLSPLEKPAEAKLP